MQSIRKWNGKFYISPRWRRSLKLVPSPLQSKKSIKNGYLQGAKN